MGRSCFHVTPVPTGLRLLHDEVTRFRATPRRRTDVRGSAQGHVTPSAAARTGTAAGRRSSKRPVPGPAEPPSGPLVLRPAIDEEDLGSDGLHVDGAGTAIPDPTPGGPPLPAGAGDPTVVELVRQAQSGDADAFGSLYDRYVDLVYRYVYYRVGSLALAEDLVSETFLRALRRIDSFTWQGRDFAAWLVTIARNLITDHFKSSRYRLEVTTEDILDAAPPQTAASPESQVLDAMTNRTLLEAVRQLNPEQQECIVLRFLQGLSVGETALVMGKNEGAIKALQYRAVRALARLLPEEKVR
jgi:RNA polymerase sigma-70 factor (ECF subfamily)